MRSLSIAVIGSGISGLSAAWLLSRKHQVKLFEADNRLGGHANTIDVRLKNGRILPIDTGFIVSNPKTYPNFNALMEHLDVEMVETDMSFSVSCAQTGYQYNSDSFVNLMGPMRQWASPNQWQLARDLVHFYRTVEARAPQMPDTMTIGEFLTRFGYSIAFVERHMLPIASAIWSSGAESMVAYPLKAFVKFFANHNLFALGQRQPWRSVRGGSRNYVKRMLSSGNFDVKCHSPVSSLRRDRFGVDIVCADGAHHSFDHVVVATHADQALSMISDPSTEEIELLSAFKTSSNRAILHRDTRVMPSSKRYWSAWNYHLPQIKDGTVAVTYWMNALQKLRSDEQHFVSLNPMREPAAHTIDCEMVYNHPIFTSQTLAAQKNLWDIQGCNRTWFSGAWFGSGFHEDGLQAGLAVAEQLGGVRRPWNVENESGRIIVKQTDPDNEVPILQAAE